MVLGNLVGGSPALRRRFDRPGPAGLGTANVFVLAATLTACLLAAPRLAPQPPPFQRGQESAVSDQPVPRSAARRRAGRRRRIPLIHSQGNRVPCRRSPRPGQRPRAAGQRHDADRRGPAVGSGWPRSSWRSTPSFTCCRGSWTRPAAKFASTDKNLRWLTLDSHPAADRDSRCNTI